MTRFRIGALWIACAAFVAYLSFVPFHFRPLSFDEALAHFAQIRYLDLGAGSRADWVANVLMFVPLGWLAAAWFVPRPQQRFEAVAIVPALLLGAALAVVTEFAQVYFPNRTVSINDIVAEVLGTLLGAVLWSAFGASSRQWWRALVRGGHGTAVAALAAYSLGYVVLSFSPFDFIISAAELSAKAASGLHGWWMAPVSCAPAPCSVKLAGELLAVLPLGWWWAMRRRGGGTVVSAALAGLALGAVLEAAQFLVVSGVSQGASVLARGAGMAAGAWGYAQRRRIVGFDWQRYGRPLVVAALPPYAAAVAYVAGWLTSPWLGLDAGLARIGDIQWMPFFYQYYSTEQALIRSTLVHLALYAPIGMAVWLWRRTAVGGSAAPAALLAAAAAFVAESGKLFFLGKHPDYTDVLIAAASAWVTLTLLRWTVATNASAAPPAAARTRGARLAAPLPIDAMAGQSLPAAAGRGDAAWTDLAPQDSAPAGSTRRDFTRGGTRQGDSARLGSAPAGSVSGHSTPRERASIRPASPEGGATMTGRAAGIVLLLLAALSVAFFPLWRLPLAVGLAAYALLLWRFPTAYLLVVPAALPLLDLAPASGRFFWDEFDFLLAVTLGVRLLAGLPAPRAPRTLSRVALALLGTSVMASSVVAMLPPDPLDANAFSNYLSSYNALRIGRGYAWAAALLWLLAHDIAADGRQRLLGGFALGLFAATAGVLWERWLFVGLADFGAWFRAAGRVSSTHVGGAYLEAMLVMLTPFALALAAGAGPLPRRLLWFGVALLGALAVLMTLSRAAFAAWLLAVLVFAALWSYRTLAGRGSLARVRRRWVGVAAALALAVFGGLLASSTALVDRLTFTGSDFAVRTAHWRQSLDLLRTDGLQALAGLGLGSFPREFYLAHGRSMQLPAYRLGREGEGTRFLSLSGGRGMYIDQRLNVLAGTELRLRGRVRSPDASASVAIGLCRKSFLTSVGCDWVAVGAGPAWQPFEVLLRLPSGNAARAGAPVALSLHNRVFGKRIDVTDLSLLDGGTERLRNGAFARGLDHWLMHSDAHLAWRVHSTPLQITVEQGALGLLAWLIVAAAVVAGLRSNLEPAAAAAVAAAAVGVLVVGLFDSLLDSPRIVMLLAMVLAPALLAPRRAAAGEVRRAGAGFGRPLSPGR